jgi:hypothetical protein
LPEEKKEKYFSWFEKVYKKAISVSLNYANAIYHFWLRSGKDNPDFCSRTMELFKNIFKGNPERLIKVLDPEFPFGLCNFIYELNKCAKFNGQKFDWFANTLIETIKLKPAQMIPEVSTMLVDASVGKNSSYGNLAFKEDFAKKMCPQNSVYINLLKQLSRNDVELPKFEPSYSVDKFINKAQSFAKEELEKYNNQ